MRLYWLTIEDCKKTISLEGFEVVYGLPPVGSSYPLVVEVSGLDNRVFKLLPEYRPIIFCNRNVDGFSYDDVLVYINSLALNGCPMFFNLKDLLFHLKMIQMLKECKTVEQLEVLIKEIDGGNHSKNVGVIFSTLSSAIGLDSDKDFSYLLGLIHDIGKAWISHSLITDSTYYSNSSLEKIIIKTHPVLGYLNCKKVLSSELLNYFPNNELKLSIFLHHERKNGSGYPIGMKNDIPFLSSLIAVSDVYDALRSARPYRGAMEKDHALSYIKAYKNNLFLPKAVDVFLEVVDDVEFLYQPNGGESVHA